MSRIKCVPHYFSYKCIYKTNKVSVDQEEERE